MKNLKQKGFTLVELMVVIAIIGILSAIITANFTIAKSKSRDGQRISDVAQIQLALAGYFNQCNAFPASLTIPSSGTTDTGCPSGINLGSFISKIPTPPAGASPSQSSYAYATGYSNSDPNHTLSDYVLEANLENNSTVSTESLSIFPTTSGMTYSPPFTCDSMKNYCVGPK